MAGLSITVDTGNSEQAVRVLTRALENLQRSGNNAANAANGVSQASNNESKAIAALVGSIDPVSKALDDLDDKESKLRKAFSSGKIDDSTYRSLQGQLDATRDKYARMRDELENGDFKRFVATLDPVATALQKIAEREQQLNKYHAEGKIPVDKYREYVNVLAQARAELDGTAEGERQMQQSRQMQQQQLQQLIAELLPTATALDQVTAKRRQLGEAFSRGDITSAQFTQANAALDRMKNNLNGVTAAQQRAVAAAKAEANALQGIRDRLDPVGVQLQRVSKEIVLLNEQFSKRNIGETEHAKLMANLKAEEAELERLRVQQARGSSGNGSQGISSAQRQFADRYLPNQVHDAARSLASGMSPMTVLFQQGSQVKDMYGSVGEALKGVGGYLTKLVNPAVLATAAIAGIGYAAYSIGDAFIHTRDKILLSGRSLQEFIALQGTAMSVRTGTTGVSFNSANDSVAAAATNAKIAYGDIERVAKTAAQAHASLGKSVEDTVTEFASLKDGGTAALVSLNDKYGFLSVSQYEQIRNLQNIGKETEAATLGQDLYLKKMQEVAKKSEESLPAIKRMWRDISNEMGYYTNGLAVMMGYGSKLDELNMKVENARARVKNMSADQNSWLSTYNSKDYARLQKDLSDAVSQRDDYLAMAKSQDSKDNDSKIAVNKRNTVDNLLDSNLGTKERTQKDRQTLINRLRENGASEEEVAKALKGFDEKHKEHSKAQSTAGESMLKSVREQGASLEQQLKALEQNAGNLSDAEKALAKFDQKIADIKKNGAKSGSDKDMIQNESAIRAQLEDNSLVEEAIRLEKEKHDILKKQEETHKKAIEDIKAMNDATAMAVETSGMGSKDSTRYQQRKAISSDSSLSEEDRTAKMQALENSYRQVDAAQKDWGAAASTAWEDFKAQSTDVASTVSSGMKSAFDQATSAMTTFITTGKLSFTDLLNTAANTAAKIGMQYASMALFGGAGATTGAASYTSMFSTGGIVGKPRGYATGGHIKGAGTGTSDSIPAMLSNGEFVVNEKATQRNRGLLEAINASGGSTMAKFAEGGAANGSAFSQSSGTSGGISIDMKGMTVNASGAEEGKQAAQAMSEELLQIMEARIAQSEGKNKQFVINQTTKSGGLINSAIKSRR